MACLGDGNIVQVSTLDIAGGAEWITKILFDGYKSLEYGS